MSEVESPAAEPQEMYIAKTITLQREKEGECNFCGEEEVNVVVGNYPNTYDSYHHVPQMVITKRVKRTFTGKLIVDQFDGYEHKQVKIDKFTEMEMPVRICDDCVYQINDTLQEPKE